MSKKMCSHDRKKNRDRAAIGLITSVSATMRGFLVQALVNKPDSSENPFCHPELVEGQKDCNEWQD